jgi:IS5 family transposase
MRRPNKHHALTPRQQQLNNLIARRRAAVETTFATWKRRMGLIRARYVGLARVTGQILMVAMAFNLRRVASLTA